MPRGDAGFTLVEALVAAVIFAVVSTALMGVLTSSVATHRLSRDRTTAQQAVQDQIEYVRRLDYASVGIQNGNPPGVIQGTKTVTGPGFVGTVTTTVAYVNDPTPTSYATYANYKKVTVSVTRNRDSKLMAQDSTFVSPVIRDTYGGINNAIIKATVQDYVSTSPVQGATVTLAPPSPEVTRNDVTDANGQVTFPALLAPAGQYYDLTVANGSNYATLPDDTPTGNTAHTQLAPGQLWTTTLRIFQKPTINVTVLDASTGLPYTGTATVNLDSPRAAQSFTITGGTGQVPATLLAYPRPGSIWYTAPTNEPIVPNLSYTLAALTSTNKFAPTVAQTVAGVSGYPGNLTASYTLTLPTTASIVWPLTVHVQTSGGTAVSNARVEISAGPVPTYLLGTTDGSGNVTINVPAGTSYTITATGPTGLTGTWSGTIQNPYTTTIAGTAGLNNYYRLGETSGTSAADSKGTATGTYTNGPTLGISPGAIAGDTNKAVSFDGVNDYVTAARQISTSFSIEFWFKSTQGISTASTWKSGAGLVDASASGSSKNDFGVSLRSDGKIMAGTGNPDTTIVSASGGYNNGAWHQVVFTRATGSPSQLRLYVDGTQVASGTSTNSAGLTAQANVNIGRIAGSATNYFAGQIDEVSLYSSALSAATVTAHVPPTGSTQNVTVN